MNQVTTILEIEQEGGVLILKSTIILDGRAAYGLRPRSPFPPCSSMNNDDSALLVKMYFDSLIVVEPHHLRAARRRNNSFLRHHARTEPKQSVISGWATEQIFDLLKRHARSDCALVFGMETPMQ